MADLHPIERIPRFIGALLVAAGTEDRETTFPEAQRLYDAAAAPKELWAVPGAGHRDLYRFAPDEYRRRVIGFLRRNLSAAPQQALRPAPGRS